MDSRIYTAGMNRELEEAANVEDFLVQNADNMLDQSLSEHLMMLLDQKQLRRSDVVRDSGLEKVYVYDIFGGKRKPSRDKLIAIAFGLHLNKEETQRMLKLGGCSELYARVSRDAVILFAIQRGMPIEKADDLLDSNGFPTILDP